MKPIWPFKFRASFLSAVVLASLMAGPLTPVSADAGCNTGAPQSDLALTQAVTTTTPPVNVVYTLSMTNFGPCSAPGAALSDDLPAGSNVVAISTSPSSWRCSVSGTAVSCALTATIGVPGNARVTIMATPATGTDVTNAAVVRAQPADPFPNNNSSWAGFLTLGGTVTAGPQSSTAPSTNFPQTTQVGVPSGFAGSSSIAFGPANAACPAGFPQCFGSEVMLTSPGSTAANRESLIFSYDASMPNISPFGQLGILHLPDGGSAWMQVPNCGTDITTSPDPCLLGVTRATSSTLVSAANPRGLYFQLTVLTSQTSDWWG